MNTALGANAIATGEATSILNFKITDRGSLETRDGLVRYSTSALTNPPSNLIRFPLGESIGGFSLFVDDDVSWVYKFYENLTDISSATYKWTASGAGTNEYYCEIAAGGDPSLDRPERVQMSSTFLVEGTLGSLADHEWGYGDNDTLGYDTIYIRDNTGDPDVSGVSIYTMSLTGRSIPWATSYPASVEAEDLIVTENDHKLYYLDPEKAPVYIATLSGDTNILPFGTVALLLDGGYIKVWNRSSGTVTLCYDDGSGTNGYQHTGLGLTADTELALYTGGNTKAGIKFTAQAWDEGYTITCTSVEVYLKIVEGTPGTVDGDNVGCELYDDNGILIATSTTTFDAGTLTDAYVKTSFTFDSGTMYPETIYWAVVTYDGGGAADYVSVACDTVASGGNGKIYDGAWDNDAAKLVLAGVKPGRPPRASFGIVHNTRVYVAGDGDHPGWVHYCGTGDCFDWSTANDGGYVGAVDDNAQNYPVGAILGKYGDIYIFGQRSQPYIAKFTGTIGSTDDPPAVVALFQNVYTTPKTAIDVINDVWFANNTGINNMTGVEQYGDLRTYHESDAVKDIVLSNWDDSRAFAGYYGFEGQYFLVLPHYRRVLVVHTKNPSQDESGKTRYPITEYCFIRQDLSTSAYEWNDAAFGEYVSDDCSADFTATWKVGNRFEASAMSFDTDHYQLVGDPAGGATAYLYGSSSVVVGHTYNISVQVRKGADGTGAAKLFRITTNSTPLQTDVTTTADWQTVTATWTATSTSNAFGVYSSDSTNLAGIEFKNFKVIDITADTSNVYYCTLTGGVTASIESPSFVLADETVLTEGTLGSLNDHEWAFGDNNNLGFNTLYFRDDSGNPSTTGLQIRTGLMPTMFSEYNNTFFVGGDDGYIYYLSGSSVNDNGNALPYCIIGKFHEIPFGEICLDRYKLDCEHDGADSEATVALIDETVTLDNLDTALMNLEITLDIYSPTRGIINWNAQDFQLVMRRFNMQNAIFRFNKLNIEASSLSR